MRKLFYAYLLILFLTVAGLGFPTIPGLCLEGGEYQIKGAMMVNFIKFIQWPESIYQQTGGILTIGVVGEDPFGPALEPAQGRMIGGYSLAIRHIDSLEAFSQCQVLFLSRAESHRTRDVLAAVAGLPIVTIGEDPDFLSMGGIIRFYTEKNHVRFEINNTAANAVHLKISAKLIEIAGAVQ